MAELKDILDRIAAGTIDVEQVAPRVAELVRSHSFSPAADWREREERALEDKASTDTFIEVSAAWISGRITEEQYAVLRRAVVGGAE